MTTYTYKSKKYKGQGGNGKKKGHQDCTYEGKRQSYTYEYKRQDYTYEGKRYEGKHEGKRYEGKHYKKGRHDRRG